MIFITGVLPRVISSASAVEVIDQSQIEWCGCVMFNEYLAQSFRPTKEILSKVELLLYRFEHPTSDMIVSIRDSLYGEDIVRISVPAENLPDVYGWVTFDFENITVHVDKTYYIVFTLEYQPENPDEYIMWGFNGVKGLIRGFLDDPYRKGSLLEMNTHILFGLWHRHYPFWRAQLDFCFKTYGYS